MARAVRRPRKTAPTPDHYVEAYLRAGEAWSAFPSLEDVTKLVRSSRTTLYTVFQGRDGGMEALGEEVSTRQAAILKRGLSDGATAADVVMVTAVYCRWIPRYEWVDLEGFFSGEWYIERCDELAPWGADSARVACAIVGALQGLFGELGEYAVDYRGQDSGRSVEALRDERMRLAYRFASTLSAGSGGSTHHGLWPERWRLLMISNAGLATAEKNRLQRQLDAFLSCRQPPTPVWWGSCPQCGGRAAFCRVASGRRRAVCLAIPCGWALPK